LTSFAYVFSEERNALEAISNGAVSTVSIVAAIIANLIVFLALLAFIDNIVEWFVSLIGYDGWNFEVRTMWLHIL
jgi:pyrimidine nucleoside transport protein